MWCGEAQRALKSAVYFQRRFSEVWFGGARSGEVGLGAVRLGTVGVIARCLIFTYE